MCLLLGQLGMVSLRGGGGGGHTISASVHGHTRASSCSHINLFILTSKLSIQKHLPVMAMLLHTVSHIGVHPHTAQPRFFFYGKPSSVLPVTVTEALDPRGESGLPLQL